MRINSLHEIAKARAKVTTLVLAAAVVGSGSFASKLPGAAKGGAVSSSQESGVPTVTCVVRFTVNPATGAVRARLIR